jgi:hypothetical protein
MHGKWHLCNTWSVEAILQTYAKYFSLWRQRRGKEPTCESRQKAPSKGRVVAVDKRSGQKFPNNKLSGCRSPALGVDAEAQAGQASCFAAMQAG